MTIKEGLKKKLVDRYIQSGHNLIFFDELTSKDKKIVRNQLSLDQEETPIILYKNIKESIVITSTSFHFLDRNAPKNIRFNEIEEWRLSLFLIAERMKEKKLSKRGANLDFCKETFDEYVKCFNYKTIRASCEDYRASPSCDLDLDNEDFKKIIKFNAQY